MTDSFHTAVSKGVLNLVRYILITHGVVYVEQVVVSGKETTASGSVSAHVDDTGHVQSCTFKRGLTTYSLSCAVHG